MKRIVYEVVVAKTPEDNELMNYEKVCRTSIRSTAEKRAELERRYHPEHAFIVLEEVRQVMTEYGWDVDMDSEQDHTKVLEHY